MKINLFPNDKDIIKKELQRLSKSASFDKKESHLQMLLRVGEIAEFFLPTVSFIYKTEKWSSSQVNNRNELSQKLAAIFSQLNSLDVSFKSFDITAEKINATVLLLGKAKWLTNTDTQYMEEEINLTLEVIKKDSKWLIKKVANTKPISSK